MLRRVCVDVTVGTNVAVGTGVGELSLQATITMNAAQLAANIANPRIERPVIRDIHPSYRPTSRNSSAASVSDSQRHSASNPEVPFRLIAYSHRKFERTRLSRSARNSPRKRIERQSLRQLTQLYRPEISRNSANHPHRVSILIPPWPEVHPAGTIRGMETCHEGCNLWPEPLTCLISLLSNGLVGSLPYIRHQTRHVD